MWETVKLPPGQVLIPGVISHATNIVEHPELVAERMRALRQDRRARECHRPAPIAASRRARSPAASTTSIMWAKLKSLAEGARIATTALWGKQAAA